MAAKRNYNIKGTKDFLVLAVVFFFLCIWAVIDAWFPTQSTLKRRPQRVEVAFEESGVIKKMHVDVGSQVSPPEEKRAATLIAELRSIELDEELENFRQASDEARQQSQSGDAEAAQKLIELRGQISDVLAKLEAKKLYTPEMGKEKDGTVIEVLVGRHDYVEAGQPVVVIKPNSHFYVFNISLAIFSFIAFWVFLLIHIFGH